MIELKISIHIEPHAGYTYDDIVILAKAAEDAGFFRFTVSDHFFGYIKGTENQCYDAWTILALLTPQTEYIRLGTMVTSQSYRNPALLAKIIANLDNASNGRIDLGIGAGWKEPEYEAYGYPFPSAKQRILQLREALQIINLLWTEDRPSFNGVFYKIKETMFLPKPKQKPRPPVWIGSLTLKAPMIEETAALYGDGLDYDGASPDVFTQKKERMKEACEKVGRNFLEMSWSVSVIAAILGEDETDFNNRKKDAAKQNWLHEEFTKPLKQKYLEAACATQIAGPPDPVLEQLSEYKKEVDIISICLPFFGNLRKNGLDTIRILKESIIPRI